MHSLDRTIALLTRTPAALDALLRGLPDPWIRANEGENTWSAFDVVGHLIHCERTDWMPRARIILEFGETRPFDPFDRWGHVQAVEGKSVGELLDDLARERAANLDELRGWNLTDGDLAKRGRHPALGTITLGELLAAWAAHDLNHLHQIARVMAIQYREEVGPFRQYMGVMQCSAHGA
ncbi:MAG TPA: DinB family protein [Acidobacteriaceae bacterium]|jgi:hypothetical protein|nr:DinB family protein [Acidobacteriaceae bacterium]